jgi:hypothetical protein
MDKFAWHVHDTEQDSQQTWKLHLAVRIVSPQPASLVSNALVRVDEN